MKRRSLLIAYADRKMASLCDDYFSNAGYRVNTVSDGLTCLARLRHEVPDLLLLDQELPWGGGDGVLACLREEADFGRVLVVVVTDVIPIHSLSRLTVPPVVRYFGKHCPLATLRYCIDSALASSFRRRPSAARRTSLVAAR
jgi:CheY-like chemotaxis protein